MPTRELYLCDTCNQMWTIHKENLMNAAPPRFCPGCGAAIRPIKSAVSESLSGACFKGINRQLLELLYSVWMQEGLHKQQTFVAYVAAQLKG